MHLEDAKEKMARMGGRSGEWEGEWSGREVRGKCDGEDYNGGLVYGEMQGREGSMERRS